MSYIQFHLDPTVVGNRPEPTRDVEDLLEVEDPPELPKAVRIDLAHQAWKDANGQAKIAPLAREFGVSYSTLYDRIHGAIPKALASQTMQRLTVPEEKAIRNWVLELSSWNWPIRIERLRAMATELLVAKGDIEDLGVHWTDQFLRRYPELRTKFVTGLDKERVEAQDPDIFKDWFELYKATVQKYSIKPRNRYNMDEKGVMMGFIGKVKVIISKYEKNAYMVQPGNREWVSLIECISLNGRRTRPWVIFKAKQHQERWFSALPGVHIATSPNGWTDNEIGLEWLKVCFEPETRCGDDEYRLLILDGRASHISTAVIRFCIASKIIPLCLPPHTTHLLQPLDVGIFAPLANAYKAGVRERSKYIVSYSIDKIDFLEILGTARDRAITSINIEKAWKAVGLEPWNPEVVLDQLPKQPSIRPVTPPSIVSLTIGPTGETVQVPITPANVAQVDQLFNWIVEGKNLDPAMLQKLQKLRNAASLAITNSNLQRATNIDLIVAEKTKKKRSNRQKSKQYAYGRVLNEETIAEREAFCKFQDYWQGLSRIQPNLLGKPSKKSVKKASKKLDLLDVPDLQLSPSGFSLLSPENPNIPAAKTPGWLKTPAAPKTPGNPVSPTKGRALKARKAPAARTTPVVRKGRKVVTGRKAPVREKVVEKTVERVADVEPVVAILQTRSGRNVVKKPPFEAGKN